MGAIISRYQQVKELFSAKSLKRFIENIYRTDQKPSFYQFHQTADWIVKELTSFGVQARKIEIPADGKSFYGDWRMPLAWDAYDLTLEDLTNKKEIANYQKVSTHMVMGSGATPKEGLKGNLVYIENPDEFQYKDVFRKFILCNFNPQGYKKTAIEKGALGFIFHGHLEEFQGDFVRWVNSWSDDPALWAQTAKDVQFPGISISPNQFKSFRDELLSGKEIELLAKIDTKSYEGTLPLVEAFIPGQTKQELFLTGHLFEQGANDNASGCASMMEIARMFSDQKPKRGLRFLFTSELYGTIPYCETYLHELQNVIAGINIDSTAEVSRRGNKMDIIENPDSNPSYVNLLLRLIVEQTKQEEKFQFKGFLLDDNMVTDPHINIACPLVGVCSFNWHTSKDTLDIIDWDLFNDTTILCAAYANVIVNGAEAEALEIASEVKTYLNLLQEKITSKAKEDNALATYANDYMQEVSNGYYGNLNKIAKVTETQPMGYEENGPHRNYFGPLSYELILPEQRNGLGMWNQSALYPLFYSNSRRSKERVIQYSALQTGATTDRFRNYLNTLYHNQYLSDCPNSKTLFIDFRRIGVKPGDKIILHSSMKAIGPFINGGPEAVIQALLNAIGPTGTLIVPTFTPWAIKTDLRTAPSRLGIISEAFRRWPNTKRSNNPTHTVSAIGLHAEEILADHEKTTQLGIDSPLHKAAKLGAKVLHLGTKLKSCSLLHVSEVIAKVPYLHIGYKDYDQELHYIGEDGVERSLLSEELPGDSNGFHKVLDETNIETMITKGLIGKAESFMVSAMDLLNAGVQSLEKDPYLLLCDNEKCSVCPRSRQC